MENILAYGSSVEATFATFAVAHTLLLKTNDFSLG